MAETRKCVIDGKPLIAGKRLYCSKRCSNRASQVKRYGISVEDYAKLTESGKCPICGRKVRRWNMDHDHKTHRLRGATCGTCNQRVLTAITTAKQAFALLEYLSSPPAYALDGEERVVGEAIVKRSGKFWR